MLDRSTLARSLKPLIQSGYIIDNKAEGARDSVLELSEKGVSVCNEAAGLWEIAQCKFEEKLGEEQLTALENALTLLQDL